MLFLALDVMTKSSQLAVGFELAEVMISTESPLLRVRDKGTSFPLTRAHVFFLLFRCVLNMQNPMQMILAAVILDLPVG